MRMVLVVDAQNIFHCPKKNVDQMKAKFEKEMYCIGHISNTSRQEDTWRSVWVTVGPVWVQCGI